MSQLRHGPRMIVWYRGISDSFISWSSKVGLRILNEDQHFWLSTQFEFASCRLFWDGPSTCMQVQYKVRYKQERIARLSEALSLRLSPFHKTFFGPIILLTNFSSVFCAKEQNSSDNTENGARTGSSQEQKEIYTSQ